MHLRKCDLNSRLNNYRALVSCYNINVFCKKQLKPTVVAESGEVSSFIVGSVVVTTFYITLFHKNARLRGKVIDRFVSHLEAIAKDYETYGHILLGDCNIAIVPNTVPIQPQFPTSKYGVRNNQKFFGFLERKKYVALHKFANGFSNYIDIILVRGQVNVQDQKTVEDLADQILPAKFYRDHRRVIVTFNTKTPKMIPTKRKRTTEQQAVGIPPRAGTARALLLNLLQTAATALKHEHEQHHQVYMKSHARMTRLMNINSELIDVIREQSENETATVTATSTETRSIIRSESVVREDGVVESMTSTHHYKQVIETVFTKNLLFDFLETKT